MFIGNYLENYLIILNLVKKFGVILIIIIGIAGLIIFTELLGWVWVEIKHILLLDMEGLRKIKDSRSPVLSTLSPFGSFTNFYNYGINTSFCMPYLQSPNTRKNNFCI